MKSTAAVVLYLFAMPIAFANGAPSPETVGALARLEPHNGIYALAGPSSIITVKISEIPVQEGQRVSKGDVIAVFDMANIRRFEVGIARTELAQARVDAAAKRRELDRLRKLFQDKSVSRESFNEQSDASKLAQLTLEKAQLNFERAGALLEKMIIRSPVNGEVLAVHARAGEAVAESTGVAEIGDVEHMEAVAEVYETDVKYVREGQSVVFRSPALNQPLAGTVTRIAPSFTRVTIYSADPMPNTEARVVKVFITLKDSAVAARYINLQGTALIDTLKEMK